MESTSSHLSPKAMVQSMTIIPRSRSTMKLNHMPSALPKMIQVKNFRISSDKFNKYLLLQSSSRPIESYSPVKKRSCSSPLAANDVYNNQAGSGVANKSTFPKIEKKQKSSVRTKCLFMRKLLEKKKWRVDDIMSHVLKFNGDEENNLRISLAKISISSMKPFFFHNFL